MKKWILSSLALLGLAAAVLALWLQRTPATDPAATVMDQTAASAPAWPLAWRFTPGQVEHYAFTYSQENQTSPFEAPPEQGAAKGEQVTLGGQAALHGSFSLEARSGSTPASAEVLFRFESMDQHRFTILDQELLPDAAAVQAQLLDRAALVRFGPRGEVLEVAFEEETPPMFERMVQLVLSEAQLSLEPLASAWSRDEHTLHGVAATGYQVSDRDAQRATISKRRDKYQSLQALQLHQGELAQQVSYAAEAELTRQGLLRSLVADEQLRASANSEQLLSVRSHLELTHLRSSPSAGGLAARFTTRRAPGEIALTKDAERQQLRLRAAGLTREQVVADLEQWGFGARVPDHNRWLWRSAALIRLEPELVDDLVALFPSDKLSHAGRGLVLDLLVGAQTYRAQEGLLAALASPAAKADERYPALFQRLNLLRHPSPETVAFLEEMQARSQGTQHTLATNALGSAAGHLYRTGEDARGVAIGDRLLAQLRQQQDPEAQQAYLLALGNAGLPHHAAVLCGYASSSSSQVRWQTAASLRKLVDPESRRTLIGLVSDPSTRVQLRALASLTKREDFDGRDISEIANLVRLGRVDEGAYHSVVSLLAPHLETDPTVRRVFETILSQKLHDNDVKARIRAILAG